jgi:hypothetical protein
MTREEKIKLAIDKGITYDATTGKVFGVRGNEIINKNKMGYIQIMMYDSKIVCLLAHQFIYYLEYGRLVDNIDHIDGNTSNNKIDNLREISHQKNMFNIKKSKGYYFNKTMNKFIAGIKVDYKRKHLGSFDTPEEARQAYLDAKKIYHII